MKRIIAVIFIILLSGCMSADPRESRFTVSKEKFGWDYGHALVLENDSFHIRLAPSRDSTGIFNSLADSYAVDKESSARRYLADTHEVCLLELKNKTQAEQIFYLDKLHLVYNDVILSPVSPVDLPAELKRVNPKGISKNIYNSAVILTVLAAISSALLVLGDGDMKPTGVEADVLSAPDIWSGIFHRTHLKYEDLILQKNPIAPNKSKSGIVFIPRGKHSVDGLKLMYR